MFLKKNIKYIEIIVVAFIIFIGYKVIENYTFIFDLIKNTISIVSPFIYALVIAYILNPIMSFLERRFKVKRWLSIILTYFIILGLIALVCVFLIPNLMDNIISITDQIPDYVSSLQTWINEILKDENIYDIVNESGVLDYMTVISSNVGTVVITLLEGSISSVFSITSNIVKFIFGVLISVYILADKEGIIKQAKIITYMIFKEKYGDKIIFYTRTYHRMLGIYVGAKALDSLIIGILALIGLCIIKAPYAVLLALVVGVTNMVPYLGPLVGEIVGAITGAFVAPTMAIAIFVFLLALQQFDAWYLDPKLVGNKVGVKPLAVILGVIIGGGIFGPIGMLLGSPTVATLKIVYDNRVKKFKEDNKEVFKKI